MNEKLIELGRKVVQQVRSDDERIRRRWQAAVGITFMFIFVLSSVLVNRVVLALNKAAGNYGYASGTYGYNPSVTSSDYPPSVPTTLTASGISTTVATVGWTAPTTTTGSTAIATGGGSISSYKVHYGTSSLSACSGGTQTTSTSTSASLSGLNPGTLYYVAVCATDNNSNDSSALTGSFTTSSGGGGGGGGDGTPPPNVFDTVPPTTTPAVPSAPLPPPVNVETFLTNLGTTRSVLAEEQSRNEYVLTTVFGGVAPTSVADRLIEQKLVAYATYGYGVSSAAKAMGGGEVAGVIRDIATVVDIAKLKTAVTNDKFFVAADAILTGRGNDAVKYVREIDIKAFGIEQKAIKAFWVLSGLKPGNVAKWKGTAKQAQYSDTFNAYSMIVYSTRGARDLALERKAIKFVKARLGLVNVELRKTGLPTVNIKAKPIPAMFWGMVRAMVALDRAGLVDLP